MPPDPPVDALLAWTDFFHVGSSIANFLGSISELPEIRASVSYVCGAERWLFCLLPCLCLAAFFGDKPRRPLSVVHILFDAAYPIVSFITALSVISLLQETLHAQYAQWLPQIDAEAFDKLPFAVRFIVIIVAYDFFRYWSHRAQHAIPWLWHFHIIHHSQRELNPMSTHRSHPFEVLSTALFVLVPLTVLRTDSAPWVYSGITSIFWDYLIHSRVRWNLGPLGHILVSPQNHLVHHSIDARHHNRNFGTRLVLWDQLFGTLERNRACYPDTGVHGSEAMLESTMSWRGFALAYFRQFLHPFASILADLRMASRRMLSRRA